MDKRIFAIALALPASAAAQSEPEFYRYEIGIRVIGNSVASNGVGGDLATLNVGTQGTLTMDVNPSPDVFPSGFPYTQTYQVLDVGLDVGIVSTAGSPASYPSTHEVVNSLVLANDQVIHSGNTLSDSIGTSFAFDHPETGFSGLTMFQNFPVSSGLTPKLLTSLDAPLAIDPSLLTSSSFSVFSTLPGPNSAVRFEFTGVEVTVIPAAPSASLLALSGLLAARPRR